MFRIAGVFILLAGIAYGIFYIWSSTPEYSIGQVKDAVKAHDKVKFAKFVNTDEFAGAMVDDMLTQPIKDVMGGGMLSGWVVAGMNGVFKPPMVAKLKEDMNDLVETGNFAQRTSDTVESDRLLGAIDRRLCLSQNEFQKLENVRSEGKEAKVTIVLHNKTHNKDLKLDVQMQKMDGYWRITKMLNFPEFVGQVTEVESVHNNERTGSSETVRRI